MALRARQITTHAAEFWFGCKKYEQSNNIPDRRDVQLFAILYLGLNIDLRYDGVAKLSMEHFLIDSGKIRLCMNQKIKNSTEQRMYEVNDWPGPTVPRRSMYMNPFAAILS